MSFGSVERFAPSKRQILSSLPIPGFQSLRDTASSRYSLRLIHLLVGTFCKCRFDEWFFFLFFSFSHTSYRARFLFAFIRSLPTILWILVLCDPNVYAWNSFRDVDTWNLTSIFQNVRVYYTRKTDFRQFFIYFFNYTKLDTRRIFDFDFLPVPCPSWTGAVKTLRVVLKPVPDDE